MAPILNKMFYNPNCYHRDDLIEKNTYVRTVRHQLICKLLLQFLNKHPRKKYF